MKDHATSYVFLLCMYQLYFLIGRKHFQVRDLPFYVFPSISIFSASHCDRLLISKFHTVSEADEGQSLLVDSLHEPSDSVFRMNIEVDHTGTG